MMNVFCSLSDLLVITVTIRAGKLFQIKRGMLFTGAYNIRACLRKQVVALLR